MLYEYSMLDGSKSQNRIIESAPIYKKKIHEIYTCKLRDRPNKYI